MSDATAAVANYVRMNEAKNAGDFARRQQKLGDVTSFLGGVGQMLAEHQAKQKLKEFGTRLGIDPNDPGWENADSTRLLFQRAVRRQQVLSTLKSLGYAGNDTSLGGVIPMSPAMPGAPGTAAPLFPTARPPVVSTEGEMPDSAPGITLPPQARAPQPPLAAAPPVPDFTPPQNLRRTMLSRIAADPSLAESFDPELATFALGSEMTPLQQAQLERERLGMERDRAEMNRPREYVATTKEDAIDFYNRTHPQRPVTTKPIAQRGTKETAYNTPLPPDREEEFRAWKAKYAPTDSGVDYDLPGAFLAGVTPGEDGHWPDTFKKPNHPTFSDESIYAVDAPDLAGHWDEGGVYIPGKGRAKKGETPEEKQKRIEAEAAARARGANAGGGDPLMNRLRGIEVALGERKLGGYAEAKERYDDLLKKQDNYAQKVLYEMAHGEGSLDRDVAAAKAAMEAAGGGSSPLSAAPPVKPAAKASTAPPAPKVAVDPTFKAEFDKLSEAEKAEFLKDATPEERAKVGR